MVQTNLLLIFLAKFIFPNKEIRIINVQCNILALYPMFQPSGITTKLMNSNPVHGEVYLIQQYVIKFVSDL